MNDDLNEIKPFDYEISTLTSDQIDTLSTSSMVDRLNGLTTVDLNSLDLSSTTIPSITLSQGAIGGYTYSTTPNTWTTTSPWYTTGGINSAIGSIQTGGQAGTLELKGENADIKFNGKSLMKILEGIEQRLNLLQANVELEAEWDELKELGERYRELEQRCKEKAETWKKLKAMPPPQVE